MDSSELVRDVQSQVVPYELNYFREAGRLTGAVDQLNGLWQKVRGAKRPDFADVLRVREGAAMIATARWMYRSALARRETRGMHRREDYPAQDAHQHHYISSGGLDEVWTAPRALEGNKIMEAAE